MVEIVFWDHVQGGRKPLKCRVYGRLVKRGKKAVILRYWHSEGLNDHGELVILIPAIIRIRKLKPGREVSDLGGQR